MHKYTITTSTKKKKFSDNHLLFLIKSLTRHLFNKFIGIKTESKIKLKAYCHYLFLVKK